MFQATMHDEMDDAHVYEMKMQFVGAKHLGCYKEYHRVRTKTISEPLVCLAQNVHLSCVKITTISKWTETRFHPVHPK
jgi:hypothetical protein